jgi:hypothetical protein
MTVAIRIRDYSQLTQALAARRRQLGALAAWMEQEAAGWRKSVAIARCWMRKPADHPLAREIAPLGSYGRAVQTRMLELDLARANLLEQRAREIREAKKAAHASLTSSAP